MQIHFLFLDTDNTVLVYAYIKFIRDIRVIRA